MDSLELARAIDARLHDAASEPRTAIIASVIASHTQPAPGVPGDWVLVPREPTQFMLFRIHEAIERLTERSIHEPVAKEAYRMVILHAPAAPIPTEGGE